MALDTFVVLIDHFLGNFFQLVDEMWAVVGEQVVVCRLGNLADLADQAKVIYGNFILKSFVKLIDVRLQSIGDMFARIFKIVPN